MGLTARPTKKTELTKIDDIQKEFFETDEQPTAPGVKPGPNSSADASIEKSKSTGAAPNKTAPDKTGRKIRPDDDLMVRGTESDGIKKGSLKIADLLATEKIGGMRFTSRPYTIPRSLTIDLNRLKTMFKSRDLHYTQNELMDQMIKETLEIVRPENYFSLREKALNMIKSPEQCSRRTVTLSEETAAEMGELKAELALLSNRRISSDEIFSTLLAIAFSSLYEKQIL